LINEKYVKATQPPKNLFILFNEFEFPISFYLIIIENYWR